MCEVTRILSAVELGDPHAASLEKDRSRRYETANGLAADVQRYLDDEPVLACPPSAWYRARKFVRRNKQTVAVAATAAVSAVAVLVVTVVLLAVHSVRIQREQARTGIEHQRAERALDQAKGNLRRADRNLGVALEALDDLCMRDVVSRGGAVMVTGSTVSSNSGVGLYNANPAAIVTVRNSTLSDNITDVRNDGGLLTISGTTLSRSSASAVATDGPTTIVGCTLSGNSSNYQGGAINSGGAPLTIRGSTLSGNTAVLGSAIYHGGGYVGGVYSGGGLTSSDSAIKGNVSTGDGGAIDCTDITLNGTTVDGNSAGRYAVGGAITVTASTFSNNAAGNAGGAIYNNFGALFVTAATFTRNSAVDQGGGICNVALVAASSVSANSAGVGGGIFNATFYFDDRYNVGIRAGQATLTDVSSVTGNTAPAGSGADVFNNGGIFDYDASCLIGSLNGYAAAAI